MQFFLGMVVASFVTTAALIVPFINYLYRMKFVKKEEKKEVRKYATAELAAIRAKHDLKAGTPTGLGILLVAVTVMVFLTALPFLAGREGIGRLLAGHNIGWEVGVLMINFLGFGLIGLYDDVMKIFGFERTGFFGLRRWHKFALQWMVALVTAGMLAWGLNIGFVNIPIIGVVHVGWLYVPMASFLIVTFANAFDITSGLDGLGEGLLLICLLAFWVIAATQLDGVLSLFIAIWIGALLAGTYFTIYPARAFLGNASGMAFGATLALVGLLSGKITALLIIGGMFLIDGGSSLVQILSKTLLHRRVFPIAPIHHWLELRNWEEPKIVARAWLAGLMMAIIGVWLALL
jgi:phospho-N-acetylmuramoyl-pentapeptide-transferase